MVILSILGGSAKLAYDSYHHQKAKKYELVKHHRLDLSNSLQLKLHVKTKLVDDTMYVDVSFEGFPAYLSYPANLNSETAGFSMLFLDSDGFTIREERIPLRKFARLTENGKPTGISSEFSSVMPIDAYRRFEGLNVTWNMLLDAPKPNIFDQFDDLEGKAPDPCAPNLSKAERLKRLEKYGTVRQTGTGEYTVGNRVVRYLGGRSELLDCR